MIQNWIGFEIIFALMTSEFEENYIENEWNGKQLQKHECIHYDALHTLCIYAFWGW